MTTHLTAQLAIDSRDIIGEGPTWDTDGARLVWSDNAAGVIHEAQLDDEDNLRETRRWTLESSADAPIPRFGAAIPRARGGLIITTGTRVIILDEDGRASPFVRIDADPGHVRLNDARCDSQGRLWAGTITTDFGSARGALYRIDPDGTVTTVLNQVLASNGLDWSPDESTFYYIDSLTHAIDAFDFDVSRGSIRNRRTLARIEPGAGVPDGMTVDADGHIWVAIAGGGEVRRYAPDGQLIMRVRISAPVATSCAFGGPDRRTLFITSAAMRLPARFLQHGFRPQVVMSSHCAPGAGGVFVCRPGARGKVAPRFAG